MVPWEEPSAYFGGHYNILWPKDVYWTKVRQPGQPFVEEVPGYGKVYHTGNAEDVQEMMDAEGAYWYHAHPRTKSTTGYPDLIWDKPYVKNDRYLGVAFKPGMGQDNSEVRMCDWRCFDAIDTMNNMYAGLGVKPEVRHRRHRHLSRRARKTISTPNFPVNYLKIDKTPGPDDDYSPILKSLRDGNFFVTTGEILIRNYSVAGTGNQRTITADVDWTFPLNFVEVVWSDGKKVDRQVISATDLAPFGTKHFAIPFDADRQGLGAICGVGLGRQRCVRAAGVAGAEDRADDDSSRQVGDPYERRHATTMNKLRLFVYAAVASRARLDDVTGGHVSGTRCVPTR